ncbi:MAG TPA: redoxin domain-containing protein [Pyrinomonadaceae bacterium]|nr:redoxin domain-containing protein [Pyrinomonadaceae bacterium]
MELFLLIIRVILAALLVTAGVAKLADLKGAEKAARGFGVAGQLAKIGPVLLSAAEIILGAMLLFPSVSWFGAIGAAALLLIFIGMMTYQWSKGQAPDCHCFGQLHSEPVGIKSIIRNLIFFGLAIIPVLRGPAGQGLALQSVTAEMAPTILGTLAVIMLGGALLYLRKIVEAQDGLRRRLDVIDVISRDGTPLDHDHATDPNQGLPIGSPLPNFDLRDLDGAKVKSRDLGGTGKGVLFFFVSPTCEPCQVMLPEFVRWGEELADRVNCVFITSGSEKENRKKFDGLDNSKIFLDDDRRFALSVGGRWTPTALYVDREGKVASHVAAGDIAIEELVDKIKAAPLDSPFTFFANGSHHGRGLKIGVEAPDFSLRDINGGEVGKQHLIGKRTLVTFWSPTCPHCSSFLEEFKTWEKVRKNGDPNVILVSDGEIEEHKALQIHSPVLLDKGYKTAAKLGMFGTPSAVLIDENGIIATETAVGASNIWALLGRHNGTN